LYSVRKRALTERVMGLANLYFPLYEQILDQQELPLEFKYLSIVESALNPTAVSRVGATGLWQFMLNTGKLYNLKINSFIDERRDPYKSTMAACQYFKDMYAIYHDWLLVIAAYNCGAGNVNKAIVRSGGKTTFWEISKYLPRETRGYVPAFIAVTYLMNHSNEHNLTPVSPMISYFESDTVMVSHKISLGEIAEAINVPVDILSFLNPIYRKGIIPQGTEPCVLKLPTSKMNAYLVKVDGIYKSSVEQEAIALKSGDPYDSQLYTTKIIKKFHKVKKGEGLSFIADLYDCTSQDIKYWNKLRSSKLHTGQKLMVMVTVHEKKEQTSSLKINDKDSMNTAEANSVSANQISDSSMSNDQKKNIVSNQHPTSSFSKAKLVYHVVQPGDTLWNIAKRYEGVTVENLKSINQLNSNELKPGTKLKVIIGG
jgi:membrane-bound lytic murein transglycosylase D